MKQPAHPSTYIPPLPASAITQAAAAAEARGSLHPKQLDAIYSQNWFNLFVPKTLGGLGLTLPEALAVEEGLGWADGSTGWVVTLCAGANWFAGFLDPETALAIFSDPKVCLAGSGRASGYANITGNGYEITGTWRYATGAPHATAFTANCVIQQHGMVLTDQTGQPLVYSFIFHRSEVQVQADWHTTGMVATASHSFAVTNLFVPRNRRFMIDGQHSMLNDPIYQYPFLQFAEATLAVNISGMAVRFIDLCETLFKHRAEQSSLDAQASTALIKKLDAIRRRQQRARQLFYEAVHLSWQECSANNTMPSQLLQMVSASSKALAETSLYCTDELYPFCGLAAASTNTEINRVWRNIHTASQHTLLTPRL